MTKEFIKKFSNIQKRVNVEKNGYNGFGKYNYRTIDDMLSVIKPLLADAGMVLFFNDEVLPMGKKMSLMTVAKESKWDSTKKMLVTMSQNQELKEVDRIILKTTITVTDGENQLTNSAYADIDTTASMSDEQKVGAASTYARKYALNGMFAIDDGKLDPDANNNDEKSKKDMDDVSKNLDTKSEKSENSKSNNGKKEIKENDFVDKEVINKVINSFKEIGVDENTLFQNLKLKKEQIKQKDLDILREYFNQKKSEYEKEKVS